MVRKAVKAKSNHDLCRLDIQIEVLNSDRFRAKSLLLLSKYEQVDRSPARYYGCDMTINGRCTRLTIASLCLLFIPL